MEWCGRHGKRWGGMRWKDERDGLGQADMGCFEVEGMVWGKEELWSSDHPGQPQHLQPSPSPECHIPIPPLSPSAFQALTGPQRATGW